MGVNARNLSVLVISLLLTGWWLVGNAHDWEVVFPVPAHKEWKEECGACHLAFPAGMLPARSWKKMMDELADHFGEDASLDDQVVVASITRYLVENAADSPNATPRMRRIAASISPAETPQRITETPFFKYQHDEVPASIWKRKTVGSPANCGACHTKAETGSYVEREIRIPK